MLFTEHQYHKTALNTKPHSCWQSRTWNRAQSQQTC